MAELASSAVGEAPDFHVGGIDALNPWVCGFRWVVRDR